MRHGDKSFPAIYVMVVLAHVGAIAWVLLGARGCQQGLVASTAAKDSTMEKSALRLNLALPQSVAESLPPANRNPQSDDGSGRQTQSVSKGQDPASRLTLPGSAQREAKVAPEPVPPAVREVPREQLDLAEREKQAQEEARQRDAIRQAEQTRKEEELAAKEEERKLALKQQADRNAAAQTERQLAERQAEQERKKEEIARKEEERKLARELDAERKAAEAERQRKVVEQRERERRQREAASKKKEEERKLALRQEAERKAAAEAARQLAEQRDEERRAAEAARQRQLAEQRDEERRAAEAADARQRQLAEQREREEAKRIEKARVVGGTAPVSPAVIKPNLVAEEGGNGSSPEVVPAKPTGGGSPDAGVLDMDAYRATVQKMIQNRWTIPRGIVVENYPEVVVRIDRTGKVVFARNERNSGVPELDRSAVNAVRIGSQLIPLPAGYDKDVYEVKVKFQVD